MLKIKRSNVVDPCIAMKYEDIPVGTLFTCSTLGDEDDVLLKTYIALVNLNSPEQTWSFTEIIDNFVEVDGVLIISDKGCNNE